MRTLEQLSTALHTAAYEPEEDLRLTMILAATNTHLDLRDSDVRIMLVTKDAYNSYNRIKDGKTKTPPG